MTNGQDRYSEASLQTTRSDQISCGDHRGDRRCHGAGYGEPLPLTPSRGVNIMSKEQKRSSREAKKPKSDKPKGSGSTYKQSLGKGGRRLLSPPRNRTE